MFIADMLDHFLYFVTGKETKGIDEIIPILYENLEKECLRLRIDPKLICQILPYWMGSKWYRREDGRYSIKIDCGEDYKMRYTTWQGIRHLRHELKHIRDKMDGKEGSELRANIYEIFKINL